MCQTYKNTVKISCNCMKNIRSIIPSHNQSILMQSNFHWDVIVESNILVGNCLTSNIVYCDDISNSLNNNKNFYSNSLEIIFTKRYGNHCRDIYECRNKPWQPSASCNAVSGISNNQLSNVYFILPKKIQQFR